MQIKNYEEKLQDFVRRLNDVRFVGQVVFVIIVLMISWSGIKSIQTNYSLQKQISTLNQQIDVARLENTNLKLQNDYYNSNQYLELEARQNFGLASPGEKEVIVPNSVALAYTKDIQLPTDQAKAPNPIPAYQRHFQSWVDFFLHRQTINN